MKNVVWLESFFIGIFNLMVLNDVAQKRELKRAPVIPQVPFEFEFN